MMKKTFLMILFFLGWGPALLLAYSQPAKKNPTPEQARHTTYLKKYMSDFGSLVAGMEILQIKEKKPDWEAINVTLRDMEDSLYRMRMADQEGEYKAFTDVLYENLREVQAYGQKKDKKIYEAFEKMTQTCFQCHAQHRPRDYLVPKDKVSQAGEGWLFRQAAK
jgi:hypothetical protein